MVAQEEKRSRCDGDLAKHERAQTSLSQDKKDTQEAQRESLSPLNGVNNNGCRTLAPPFDHI